jgi:hypothetical protein
VSDATPPSTSGPNRRRLNANDIIDAESKVESGAATAEEMELKYPGWQEEKRQMLAPLENFRLAAAGPLADFQKTIAGLSFNMPKLDGVIARSTASAEHLRAMDIPLGPFKSGTEYAVDRVHDEISRLAAIAAEMADSTRSIAEISKTGLEQSIATVQGLSELRETTRVGIAASAERDKVIVRLTEVLVTFTKAIFALTIVLVVLAAAPIVEKWLGTTPAAAPTASPTAAPPEPSPSPTPTAAPTATPAPSSSSTP